MGNYCMEKIDIRIAEAKQRDVGRYIVRIDGDIMNDLGINTGDVITIIGKKKTVANAWPAYPENINRCIIRIDERLRINAGVSLGEKVICNILLTIF